MTPLLATHYRPSTCEYLMLDRGAWYISINGDWQRIKNPFGIEMVSL